MKSVEEIARDVVSVCITGNPATGYTPITDIGAWESAIAEALATERAKREEAEAKLAECEKVERTWGTELELAYSRCRENRDNLQAKLAECEKGRKICPDCKDYMICHYCKRGDLLAKLDTAVEALEEIVSRESDGSEASKGLRSIFNRQDAEKALTKIRGK